MEYLRTFSPDNWRKLPKKSKRRHTVTNCKECALVYKELQHSFPGLSFHPAGESLAPQICAIMQQNSTTKSPEQDKKLAKFESTYQQTWAFIHRVLV